LHTILWKPRFFEAAAWIAQAVEGGRGDGRAPFLSEVSGTLSIGGVTLKGRLDRVDLLPNHALAIIDYKTGSPPSQAQIGAGYALQLGLIGIMAQRGAFEGVTGEPQVFEYWSLGRESGKPYGYKKSALSNGQESAGFLSMTESRFREAVETWLTGDAPFKAKLAPDYAYTEYDQLMRYDEWAARDG